MDDDQFEDYVGTEETIEEDKQQEKRQKSQQAAKEITVETIEVLKDNDRDEVGHNQDNKILQMENEDNIIRIGNKGQEINTHKQSITANQQYHQVHVQHHEPYQPQQKQQIANQEQPKKSDLFTVVISQTALAQNDLRLHEQTLFPKIQQKQVEEFVHSQPNSIKNQQQQVHDSVTNEGILLNDDQNLQKDASLMSNGTLIDDNNLKNEPIHQPIYHLQYNLDYQATNNDMNQEFSPILIQNQFHGQQVQSNSDLNIDMMNFEPLNRIDQSLAIDHSEKPENQFNKTNYGSSTQQQTNYESQLIDQQSTQNNETYMNQQTHQQNDPTNNSRQKNNQIKDEQTNENQENQQQEDEFGDFETYQQSTQEIPITQTTPQQRQQASYSIQYQSQSHHQHTDSQNQTADQMILSIHPHQIQSFSQQNQLSTGLEISEPQQVQYTQIHSQVPKAQNTEPNEEFSPVKPQQNQNIQPKIQLTLPTKQLTLQDEIAAFINSLPNYKRICQKVFYNAG